MKGKNIALWVINVLIALLMIFAGSHKLMGKPDTLNAFANYGLGVAFHYFIGTCEVLGGIGVLIPRTRFWAAAGLAPILAGAVFMHATHGEFDHLPIPAVFLVLCIVSAIGRRSEAGRIFAKGGLFSGV